MVDEELELLFSPSRWSKRFDAKEVIEHHIKVVSTGQTRLDEIEHVLRGCECYKICESEISKSSVPNEVGLRYGPKEAQQYDLYGGDSLPPNAPLFVYVHGGYWQQLSRHISAYCVRPLARSGTRVAVLGYTLAPNATVEEMVDEIRCGLQVILEQAASANCQCVWVGGHSAGAHLALSALLAPRFVQHPLTGVQLLKGLVLVSGVYDLVPLLKTTVNDPLKLDEAGARLLSPLLQLGEMSLPAWARRLHMLVVVGEHDSPAFIQQSHDLVKLLEGRVSSVELMEMLGLDHFDIVENLRSDNHDLTKRIKQLIASSSSSNK